MKSKKDEKNIRFSCTYHKNFVTLHPQNEPIRSVAKQKGSGFSAVGRDLAQLVAHTSGGREVAGSSPVIPTKQKAKCLIIKQLAF